MIENEDYEFIESEKSDFYSIKVLLGAFADTVFRIDSVSLNEEEGELHLKYDYTIEEGDKLLEVDDTFGNIVGDIITKLLTDG